VRSDLEPEDVVASIHAHRPILCSHSRRVHSGLAPIHALELQPGVPRFFPE
jgi:hypothetical protein